MNDNGKVVRFNKLYDQIKDDFDLYLDDIKDCLKSSDFIGGSKIKDFEKAFAILNSSNYCVSCGNGTDSLTLAMKSLNIKPKDEVIVPALSWISTSETVTFAGGKVVFCDVNYDSFTIDTSKIQSLITENTVGIIPVHLYGHPADMPKIMKIAQDNNLWVIEDCAQAHLAEISGTKVGNFGNFGSFSFFPGKNLGAFGDAGAIVTKDETLSENFTRYARHGGLYKGEHILEGTNSRMDAIQATILLRKMKNLKQWDILRNEVANNYSEQLKDVEELITPSTSLKHKHAWHLYVIKTQRRDDLMAYLNANNIQTGIHYKKSLPFLEAYDSFGHSEKDFSVSAKLQREILSLPIYPTMSKDKINYVADKIKEFF